MPVLISGVLKDATGTAVQNCTIQLKAYRTSTTVIVNTVASENPDEAGRYSMDVEQGQYTTGKGNYAGDGSSLKPAGGGNPSQPYINTAIFD